jgi:Asp-tRNA(Asn)/Glu-tRNA(Gln) amidotransferase A subunit family amidase
LPGALAAALAANPKEASPAVELTPPARKPRPHRPPQPAAQRLHHRRPRKAWPQARAADASLAAGEGGPLTGIPLGAQGHLLHRGLAHHLRLEDAGQLRRPYDATVVERFKLPAW